MRMKYAVEVIESATEARTTPKAHKTWLKWSHEMSFVNASKWRITVFTNEKWFCLDGRDGLAGFFGGAVV